jgi:hypothetical protein
MRRIPQPTPWFSLKRAAILAVIFLIALLPRLYSAQTVGWNWYWPGSFTPINFDEANTCKSWLGVPGYSTQVGAQTVTIASLMGNPPPPDAIGNYAQSKAYCLTSGHLGVARIFSAVMGSLTVITLGLIALVLAPDRPQVAWSAALLLALSGFHATQSHMATVDASMTLYVYLFILAMLLAVSRRKVLPFLASLLLLIPAMYSKHFWPMPLFAYLAMLPEKNWQWLLGETDRRSFLIVICAALVMAALAFNTDFQSTGWWPLLALFYVFVPWRKLNPWTIPLFALLPWAVVWVAHLDVYYIKEFTSGSLNSKFGSGFGAIGWNKPLRNFLNVPIILILGLGLPAALLIPRGIAIVLKDTKNIRLWLCFLPIVVFAAYMLFIATKTNYRHYLPLIPAAALVASYGWWSLRIARNRVLMALFFIWPALLLIDIELDFHQDPRRQIVSWYEQNSGARIFASYYVSPPPNLPGGVILFKPEYAAGDAAKLKLGQFLILSENWYSTSFAQELNGPFVGNVDRLVRTQPAMAPIYRQILAEKHPNLTLEHEYNIHNFMPELILHKQFYGTFQEFVGDLKVFRIIQ